MSVEETGLKKHQMRIHNILFMIYCLCAAGAYGIEDMISEAGPGLTIVMLIALPFFWSAPMGLVAAELGSAIPEEGGYYKWVQRACGEFWGYQAGWWRTVSIYFDNTIYVVLAGSYLASVANLTDTQSYIFKASVIIFFAYINIRGIKDVSIVSTIISLCVLGAFSMISYIGFTHWHYNAMDPFIPPGQSLIASVGYGIAIALWMYSGYESMSTVAGEVENPQVIPKATLLSIPLIMASYVIPTIASIGSIGQWDKWTSDGSGLSFADVAKTNGFEYLGYVFVIVAVLANFSIYNAYIASGSRGFFALADDNLAPKWLTKCSKDRGVPYLAVMSLAVFNLLISPFKFEVIVVVDMMLLMSAYVLIFISAIILRRKEPDMPRPFRVPVGNTFFTIMCIPAIIIALITLYINGADYFLGGMIAIMTGPLTYFIFKKYYGGLTKVDPVKYPVNPKTGMGIGDLKKMVWVFGGLAVIGAIGMWFLPGYEDPTYYADTYGVADGQVLLDQILMWIKYTTIFSGAVAVITGIMSMMFETKDKNIAA
jgi:amino acid transporter